MTKYCPTCNRSSDEFKFVGEFCEVCIADRLKVKVPDSAEIDRCKSCRRIRTRDGYRVPDKNTLKEALSMSMKPRCDIIIRRFDWETESADIRLRWDVDGESIAFDKTIAVKVNSKMCLDCYRRTSGYFEATVQLRGTMEKCDRIMKKLFNFIDTRDAFASRVDELDNGYDIYVSDKKVAGAFFEYYDLKPKRAYTLYGMKSGKKLYRNVYLLRFDGEKGRNKD